MIITVPYKTTESGTKIVLTIDAFVDTDGALVLDDEGMPAPRGYYILQNETKRYLTKAYDKEGIGYTYSETDIQYEV